jgi:glycosyltransferase involved in cell wall biosynthesis
MTHILLCLSHSVEEHDQLRLFSEMGHDVFSLGGYIDPAHPHSDLRPPLPDVSFHPELKAAVDAIGAHDNLGAAQERIPDAVLDWLGDDGVIFYHHNLHRLFGQWDRLRAWRDASSGRRIVWRSVGQSVEGNEQDARPFRDQGLERVAYSPKEANIPGYSGHDALIRFYADPDEWTGWTGEDARVLNIAQHDAVPHARDEWLNWRFWEEATAGLPRVFAGSHSEKVGGLGKLPLDDMKALLRSCRVFLYTGTQPASYTLGFIEAMMTGIPVVSIGPSWMTIFPPYGPLLFEGHELVDGSLKWNDNPAALRQLLKSWYLDDGSDAVAREDSEYGRRRAIALFGKPTIRDQWARFLVGAPVPA